MLGVEPSILHFTSLLGDSHACSVEVVTETREQTRQHVCMHAHSCGQLFVTSGTVACQAPLSTGLFRQEYWSGLPFASMGESFN